MEPDLHVRLEAYHHHLKTIILARQHPVTGLFPASTAVSVHGDYRDAWVRDNVYTVLAVWGVALAYRPLDDCAARVFELEHSVVKCMRGLLTAMMKQAHKVERFKQSQDPLDALHAKYDTATGDAVVADTDWGHLQLDATALYLLILAQMISSGLTLIYSQDEANFIQNLVYYIGRSYRTPDYGIWERGTKTNRGLPELNASSVALAKAALEALAGFNLFGVRGSQVSVVHVSPDDIARSRVTLESLLPRESSSKETDAALLSAIGFPAFALENPDITTRTCDTIVTTLSGRYGLKRFLRDGHQTVIEDAQRLHYEPEELRQFEHIESEWPLFFAYLALDGFFRGDRAQADDYLARLEAVTISQGGFRLVPELYYVPCEALAAERAAPHTQTRRPNDNLPLVWAQSLYLLARLLADGLLTPTDLDPLQRHLRLARRRQPRVQIALLAEDEALRAELATSGIATQTLEQLGGIQVRHAADLAAALTQVGRNDKLGLSGCPTDRPQSLSSARVFRVCGTPMVFLPAFFDQETFYLTLDPHLLVARLRSEIAYVHRHWYQPGSPTLTLMLSRAMLAAGGEALFALMYELRSGQCDHVPIKLGPLSLLRQTASEERIDHLHDFRFARDAMQAEGHLTPTLLWGEGTSVPLGSSEEFALEVETDLGVLCTRLSRSRNLYEQVELLATLSRLCGPGFDTGLGAGATVGALLGEVYVRAGEQRLWGVLRRAAGLLGKVDVGLADAVADILVRQKHIQIGKAYSEASLVTRPLPQGELLAKIREFCRDDARDRVLTQEVILYLSLLIKAAPRLFDGLLTLRVGYLILLLTSELAREQGLSQDEGYECLMRQSPFAIQQRLRRVLADYETLPKLLRGQESLRTRTPHGVAWTSNPVNHLADLKTPPEGWWHRRRFDGTVNRVAEGFYPSIWRLLQRCDGLIIGDKLERRNRLDSATILAEMTPGENDFALRVEHLLNKITSPEYRQLSTEALVALARVSEQNPTLHIEETLVLDVVIGHGVRIAYLDACSEGAHDYERTKAAAWAAFYDLSPQQSSDYLVQAFRYLTAQGRVLEQST